MEPPLGSAGPALPEWKREILERKRAKLAAPPAGGEPEPEPEPGGRGRGRGRAEPADERLVLAESLGPLRENPFMRLESERRRLRQGLPGGGRRGAGRPLQELLELYSAVPGIRTIRADNILIIESQPDPAAAACFAAGERGRDPLRDLLARQGSALAEIRAAQVFVYEPAEPAPPGMVSRLLQKFDQRPRGRRRRSGEAEPGPPVAAPTSPASPRVRPGPVPGSPVTAGAPRPGPVPPANAPSQRVPGCPVSAAAPRPLSKPAPPARAPIPHPIPASPASSPKQPGPSLPVSPAPPQQAPVPGSPVSPAAPWQAPGPMGTSRASGFLHKIGPNSFTVTPRGLGPDSCAPLTNGPLEHSASPGCRSPQAQISPVPSPSTSIARANTQPKPERRDEIQPPQSSATPRSPHPLLASALRDRDSFEIHPAPKPDLATIPTHDLQAQALASLRLNSRNSFLVVPRRRGEQCQTELGGTVAPLKPECEQQQEPVSPPQASQDFSVPVTYIDDDIVELEARGLPQEMGSAVGLKDSEKPQEALGVEAAAAPLYRPHPTTSSLQQRGGSTFTIVPKKKPYNSEVEVNSGASRAQQLKEESRSKDKTLGSPGAPQLDLEPLLKKRYPTVHEIEVIGGYLSLERSCMSKTGSHRKKMKISFNETSLQTMFEYPSERSLAEEEEEEEPVSEGEEDNEEDEPRALFIPRPTSTMHANVPSSGFSSYTPKHSVEFSKWQEQEYEEKPAFSTGSRPEEANPPGSQVMLTPAEQSGLSGFSSEPALYF
ncbi:taperin [Carettochelys insculpta]|uniref:taperin n=1 Tax=Carettochelys insculpta TaxID=44489 RepID=UPI003EB6A00B